MQAQWNGAVDGSVHASVQGIKGEGVNRAAVQPINEIVGVYGKASNLGISDVTEAIAGLFNVANDDAIGTELGDITNAYSLLARAYTDKDTGVITNRYGLYVEDITGGGTTTNQYGIYCPALVGGGTNLFINNVSAASNFGSGNIVTTGTLGAGESTLDRLGVHTSPNATSTIYTREIFTEVDCGRKGIHSDPELQPAGALGGITTLHGALLQGHWETIEDGGTYAYLYGAEGTVHTDFVSGGGSGDLLSAIGLWGRVRHRSDGNITTAIGVKGDIYSDGDLTNNGDITRASSFLATADATKTTGVLTTRIGYDIEDIATATYTTDQYGIYCPALIGATGDNLFIKNVSAASDFGTGTIACGAITQSGTTLDDTYMNVTGDTMMGALTVGAAGDNYDVRFNSDLSGNYFLWDANYGTDLDGSVIIHFDNSTQRALDATMPGFIMTDGSISCGLFRNFEHEDAGLRLDMGWGGANGGNFELYHKSNTDRPGQFRVIYGGGDYGHIEFKHYTGAVWNVVGGFDKDGRFAAGYKYDYFPNGANGTVAMAHPFQVYNEATTVVSYINITGGALFSDTVQTAGGRIVDTTRQTTTYTALVTDDAIYCDTDGAAWTLTLPAGVDGQRFFITNCGSSGNDLTIDGNGAEEINGETTQLLSDEDSIIIIFETTEGWRVF